MMCAKAHQLIDNKTDHPLHVGITEAQVPNDWGIPWGAMMKKDRQTGFRRCLMPAKRETG